ncbi:hypothetical protein EV360DRAFT_87423 [Lentinula raphanica]|nr:hypothetical protein EV360DRAFT_87423 [Lentinula raphanica]
MSYNAFFHLSNSLLTTWTRILPKLVRSRFCSTIVYSFALATLAGGIGLSLYLTYQDLRYLWIKHQLARCIEQLERAEAKSAAANRRCDILEQISSRGRRMVDDIERWEKTKDELERMLLFNQLPAACATTDELDPDFKEYDMLMRRRETVRKIRELKQLDKHLEEEMEWWNAEGEEKLKLANADDSIKC